MKEENEVTQDSKEKEVKSSINSKKVKAANLKLDL